MRSGDYSRSIQQLLLAASISGLSLGLAACGADGDTSTATSITAPTPEYNEQVSLTGHIQGVLRDAVTNDPIRGATVDIGFASTTTNERGQFVLRDVPVTGAVDSDATGLGNGERYRVTIDLRAVNAARAAAGLPHSYPEFAYREWDVNFSSYTPEEANDQMDGGTNLSGGTYHTIISGLVTAHDEMVGKLSTSIVGTVYQDTDRFGQEAYSPVANATVYLYADNDTDNSGTGNAGRLLNTTTTNAQGQYTFTNVEANVDVWLIAHSADGLYTDGKGYTTAGGDGDTRIVTQLQNIDGDEALKLQPAELQGPVLVSVSPENNVDIDPSTVSASSPLEVRFTFSRPIFQTAYAKALDASSSAVEGLYKDVTVNFTGAKSGNIPHSLAWSADFKTLIVSIPTLGVSSRYKVDITGADLIDAYGYGVNFGANTANAEGELRFTTRGGLLAGTPAVTVTNASTINSDSAVVLNWAPVAGAKKYNVYRELVQLWNGGANAHGYVQIDQIDASSYGDGFGATTYVAAHPHDPFFFVENDLIQLAFNYRVAAVNSDGLEGVWSDPVQAVDVIAPKLVSPLNINSIATDELVLQFNEPVREADAENVANYALSNVGSATLQSATYNVATREVTLRFSEALDPDLTTDAAVLATVRVGWNGILNTNVPAVAGFDDTKYAPSLAIPVVGRVELPMLSAGWCAYSDTNGNFFSTNSEDYAASGYVVYTGGPSVSDVTDTTADGRIVVFTGPDGICDTLNDWATDLTSVAATWPVADVANVTTGWTTARTAISDALLPAAGMNSTVSFRIATQAEALNQVVGLTHNGYTFGDVSANPVVTGVVSEWTLGEVSRTIANVHHYFYVGSRSGQTISNLPTATTANFYPTLPNYALRPTALSAGVSVYEVDADTEALLADTTLGNLADSDTLAPSVEGAEILRPYITAASIRDIKGNLIEAGQGSVLSGELQHGVIATGAENVVSH